MLNPIGEFLNSREMLSGDWNDDEWNYFFNWWFRAIQYWMQVKDLPPNQDTLEQTGGLPEKKALEGFGIVLANQKIQKMVQTGVALEDQYYYIDQIEKLSNQPLPEITKKDFVNEYIRNFKLENNSEEQNKELKKRINADFEVVVKAEGKSLKKNKGQNRYMKKIQGENDAEPIMQEIFHILGL